MLPEVSVHIARACEAFKVCILIFKGREVIPHLEERHWQED